MIGKVKLEVHSADQRGNTCMALHQTALANSASPIPRMAANSFAMRGKNAGSLKAIPSPLSHAGGISGASVSVRILSSGSYFSNRRICNARS